MSDKEKFPVTYEQAEKIAQAIYKLGQELTCPVCLSLFQNPYYMPCNHAICYECAIAALKVHKQCPLCKCSCNKRMLNPATQLAEIINAYKTLHPQHTDVSLSQLSQPDPPEILVNEIQNNKKRMSVQKSPIKSININKSLTSTPDIKSQKRVYRIGDTPSRMKSSSSSCSEQCCGLCKLHTCMSLPSSPRLVCVSCHICVHAACYALIIPENTNPDDLNTWKCDTCRNNVINEPCFLCHYTGTIMRSIQYESSIHYIHINCAKYMFLLSFISSSLNEPLILNGLSFALSDVYRKRCCICKRNNNGITTKCSDTSCKNYVHISCAFNDNLYLAVDEQKHIPYVYCPKHSEFYRTRNLLLPDFDHSDKFHTYIFTGLNKTQRQQMQLFTSKYKYTLADSYRTDIQVCIVDCTKSTMGNKNIYVANSRTMKYMLSLLGKKYVIAYQYIEDSLEKKQLMNILDYEVYGDNECKLIYSFIPSKYRKDKDLLFDGCTFYLFGSYHPPCPSLDDCIRLIQLGGGEVTTELQNIGVYSRRNYIILCCINTPNFDEAILSLLHYPNVHAITYAWLFDSISNIQLCDYVKYSVHT